MINSTFAQLFKKYRLRSEIETLAQFGELLAQEGLHYENSLFTHWQRGDRIPKDRKVVLKIIEIFAKHQGIRTLKEVNGFVASAGMRDLDNHEQESICAYLESETGCSESIQQVGLPELTYGQALRVLLRNITASKYFYWIITLYFILTIWHIRIWTLHLYNTTETTVLGEVYGVLALSSGFYIYSASRKKDKLLSTRYFEVSKYLSFGLLSQWIGLQIWTYYNLTGVKVPYPSLADIGYFGLIPLYALAALKLYKSPPFSFRKRIIENKSILLFIPLIILLASYSIFLQTTGFDLMRQIKVALNAIYPLGEIIPIFIVLYAFIKTKLHVLSKINYLFLLFAFLLQFFAEYSFIYTVQINGYVNGGLNDYLYVSSYMLMNLVIISFTSQYAPNFISNVKKMKTNRAAKQRKMLTILPLIQISENR